MEVTYIGHSCFKIKGKSATVVTDPYDSKLTGYRLPKLEADILTISHNHPDHSAADGVNGAKLIVTKPGEYELMDTFVMAIPTFHDNKSGEERGGNLITLIEMDGFNILHLGDLGHTLAKETLEKLPEIHVLMIPVGGTYTIDSEQASNIIADIEPYIVLPMHYQTDDLTGIDKKLEPVQKFLNEMGLKGEIKAEDKLKVSSKSDLPEDTKVVLLTPQH